MFDTFEDFLQYLHKTHWGGCQWMERGKRLRYIIHRNFDIMRFRRRFPLSIPWHPHRNFDIMRSRRYPTLTKIYRQEQFLSSHVSIMPRKQARTRACACKTTKNKSKSETTLQMYGRTDGRIFFHSGFLLGRVTFYYWTNIPSHACVHAWTHATTRIAKHETTTKNTWGRKPMSRADRRETRERAYVKKQKCRSTPPSYRTAEPPKDRKKWTAKPTFLPNGI